VRGRLLSGGRRKWEGEGIEARYTACKLQRKALVAGDVSDGEDIDCPRLKYRCVYAVVERYCAILADCVEYALRIYIKGLHWSNRRGVVHD
jgi:hypothetical protein